MATVSGARTSAVVRGAAALMFSTVAASALGMVFWLVAARLVDAHQLGRAAAGASAITLLAGLSQLSLNSVFVRFLPTAGPGIGRFLRFAYTGSGSVAVLLAVGFFTLGLAGDFLPSGPLSLAAFCAVVVCVAFTALHDGVLTATHRISWVPVGAIAVALAKLALLPILAGAGVAAAPLYAWAVPITLMTVVMGVAIFGWVVPARVREARGRALGWQRRELASFMAAENVNGVLGALILYVPPVLVTLTLGPEHTAYFYVPWLIATAVTALCWNITISFVVAAASDPAGVRGHLRHAIRLLLLLTVGGGAVLATAAPYVLAVIGARYAESGAVTLRLIGLALPFVMVAVVFSMCALLEKRAWSITAVQCAAVVLFLGGAYLGLREFGVAGAAGAYLACHVLLSVVLAPLAVRRLRRLVHDTEAAAAGGPTPASGAASVAASGVSSALPGFDLGPVQVVHLPDSLIDWERLGAVETQVLARVDRAGAGLPGRGDPSVPAPRLPVEDVTVAEARRPDGRG